MRAILGGGAAVLFLGGLVFAHIAAWNWLLVSLTWSQAALIIAAVDFLLAVVLVLVACRSSPDAVERDALALRERALDEAADSLTVPALLIRLIDLLTSQRPRE
jgi:hypothetical protein